MHPDSILCCYRCFVRSDVGRRVVLAAPMLAFFGIAVASAIWPHKMAEGLGYRLDNVDALSEYRAIYVGLWLAHVAIFALAQRRLREAIFGDLGALLILGQVAGRLLSLGIDGVPSRVLPIAVAELLGGLAILFVRPQK